MAKKIRFEDDKKTKNLKVIDKVGYVIAETKYKSAKDLEKKKRMFKKQMSFIENVHVRRADSGMFKKQNPIYEHRLFVEEDEDLKTIKSNMRKSMQKGRPFQYYMTAIITLKNTSVVAHGRSNQYSDKNFLSDARKQAHDNLMKQIDVKVNLIVTKDGYISQSSRGSSISMGLDTFERLQKNLQIDVREGIYWVYGG